MNPSGKFVYIIIELSKIQNSTASSYKYIYAFIYVGYTEKQYIEKQDALFAVSCSLREMERVQQWTGYFTKRTNKPKNTNL